MKIKDFSYNFSVRKKDHIRPFLLSLLGTERIKNKFLFLSKVATCRLGGTNANRNTFLWLS